MSHVLVDIDGTIADWGAGWDRALDALAAPASIRRHAQQASFDLTEGCSPWERELVTQVMDMPGFYARLNPIAGAITALNEITAAGHDVHVVTSPWITNPTCASDKIAWMMRHFGTDWGRRVVITSDKTLVHGDYLIDDKPTITGVRRPPWEHVVFHQPYNVTAPQRRMTSWDQWKEVIA